MTIKKEKAPEAIDERLAELQANKKRIINWLLERLHNHLSVMLETLDNLITPPGIELNEEEDKLSELPSDR